MEKNAIKKFAVWARTEMLTQLMVFCCLKLKKLSVVL